MQPAVHVPLGDAHHESEIGFAESLLCFRVPCHDSFGKLLFLLVGEQLDLTYVPEIRLDRILDVDSHRFGIVVVIGAFPAVAVLFKFKRFDGDVVIQILDDLNVHAVQPHEEALDYLWIYVDVGKGVHDLLLGNAALCLRLLGKFLEN